METNMKAVSNSARVSAGITAAICGALGLCSSVTAAADSSAMPQAVVQYGDLDLANPQNARELYSRISAAASRACTSYPVDGRSLAVYARLRTCTHQAVADAVVKINQPALFAVYNSKNRTPVANGVAYVR